MAENNVGMHDTLESNSLIHYNETGVLAAIASCKKTVTRFNTISGLIPILEGNLCHYWDGIAHDAFHDRFIRVFNKVRDIDDALDQLYDILMKAQAAFYETDDKFSEQLKEAIHKSSGAKSESGSQGGGETYSATVGDGFVPALTYTPLPAKPVLVSTMGQAYTPDLSYVAMSPKPELCSCLPSAVMVVLAYQSLSMREEITHNTAEALQQVLNLPVGSQKAELTSSMAEPHIPNLDYTTLEAREELSSTLGEALFPDLSYTTLEAREELSSTIGEAYFPDFTYATLERRGVLQSMVGAAVISQVIDGYLKGSTREEMATQIGEAVIGQLGSDYPSEMRDVIVQNVGEAVVANLFGDGTGAVAGTGLPSADNYSAWSTNLNTLIDDTVSNTFEDWYLGDAIQRPQLIFPSEQRFDSVPILVAKQPEYKFQLPGVGVNPVASMANVSAVEPSTVTVAMGQLADHSNGVAVQRIIAGSVQEKSGCQINLSMLPNTSQSVSQSGYTIQISTQTDGGASLQTLIQHDASTATLNVEAITGIAKDMCQSCVVMDFSMISFPVPAA